MAPKGSQFKGWNVLAGQHHRYLSSVMNVVRHDSPKCPLIRNVILSTAKFVEIGLKELVDRPLIQYSLDRSPRQLDPLRQDRALIGSHRIFNDMASFI